MTRAFRKHLGCSIGDRRRRARVDRAVSHLAAEAPPLVDLAQELGYCDQGHFCREFKRETGTTPGSFRAATHRAPCFEQVSIVQDQPAFPS